VQIILMKILFSAIRTVSITVFIKKGNVYVNNGKDISMNCISPDVKTNLSKKQLT